jgi:hypothetical protein
MNHFIGRSESMNNNIVQKKGSKMKFRQNSNNKNSSGREENNYSSD